MSKSSIRRRWTLILAIIVAFITFDMLRCVWISNHVHVIAPVDDHQMSFPADNDTRYPLPQFEEEPPNRLIYPDYPPGEK